MKHHLGQQGKVPCRFPQGPPIKILSCLCSFSSRCNPLLSRRDSARTAKNQKKHTQKEQATNRKAKGSGFVVIQEYHASWILIFQSFVACVGSVHVYLFFGFCLPVRACVWCFTHQSGRDPTCRSEKPRSRMAVLPKKRVSRTSQVSLMGACVCGVWNVSV